MGVKLVCTLALVFYCAEAFRLPRTVQPTDYRLDLQPHFVEDNFTLYGEVWIVMNVLNDADRIVLHCSRELDIVSLDVLHNETLDSLQFPSLKETSQKNSLSCGVSRQQDDILSITACSILRAGNNYRLHIRYKGYLSSSLTGFYRSSYLDHISNETRWLASTVFEPNHARRAFPCFDEPGFKSHFQVNIASHREKAVLSNMPQHSTHNFSGKDDWVWTRFHRSPVMSSYLVAFFVGKMESRKTQTRDGTLIRVWARPEVISQTKYALDIGPRILEYFNELLGVQEPLPKHDILALPTFVANALENWGLISFGEKFLLYEEGVTPESKRQQIAFTLSHEFAHSWFGNLISLRWWQDIWLNEGFADYFAALGANHIQSEWETSSVATVNAFLEVFSVDSLHSSLPLTIPLQKQYELQQIFNTISYLKGFYLLRMLNHSLGESTFLDGCRRYIHNNSYKAVDQKDLWNALTEQAHIDEALPRHLHLAEVMDTWTSQSGFPVVDVVRNYTTGIAISSQAKFERLRGDVEFRQRKKLWWIPVTYTTQRNLTFDTTKPQIWMTPDDNAIQIIGLPGDENWLLLNIQASGLYRVNYDQENWELLSRFLNSDRFEEIPVLNRALLLDDVLNLARVGQLPYRVALDITNYLQRETHYLPWRSALKNLNYIVRMLHLTEALHSYRLYVRKMVAGQFNELGFEPQNNSSYLKGLHQKEIVRWACQTGLQECVDKARELFDEWSKGTRITLPRSLRSVMYCTAIKHGGPVHWNTLWAIYKNTTSRSERNTILTGLGCSKDANILKSYLEWAVENSPSECIAAFKAVAASNTGFPVAKEFFFNNIENNRIIKKVGIFYLREILEIISSRMNQPEHLQALEEFERKHSDKLQAFSRSMNQMKERVVYNIHWLHNNYDDISTWLQPPPSQ